MKLKLLLGASATLMGLSSVGSANADIPPPHGGPTHHVHRPQPTAAPKTVVVKPTSATATAHLKAGDTLEVQLGANATTGYHWSVVSTSRSLGYPETSYKTSLSHAMGAGGTAILRWKTSRWSVGANQVVKLAYARGRGAAAHTLTLKVTVAP